MTTKQPARQSQATAASKRAAPPDQAIAERAYEFFLSRDGEHGHDLDDWLLAEAEIIRVPAPAPAKPLG